MLETLEVNEQYSIFLLHLVDRQTIDINIRVAGSIALKNYIKRNWAAHEDDGGPDRISRHDRSCIKALLINLMLKSPKSIQKQLSDAIQIIGKYDFPKKWPQLITDMVEKFSTGDFNVVNGILQTAHSLFKRYRFEFKSQALWEEIKFVLEKICDPLTNLLLVLMRLTKEQAGNAEAVNAIYGSLCLISKIFYSLNYQDLPEFFEDHIQTWMNAFHELLNADVPLLNTNIDDEPGIMEHLKSEICLNIGMYAQKYDEEFRNFTQLFVTDVWELLVKTGMQTKYDTVSN